MECGKLLDYRQRSLRLSIEENSRVRTGLVKCYDQDQLKSNLPIRAEFETALQFPVF